MPKRMAGQSNPYRGQTRQPELTDPEQANTMCLLSLGPVRERTNPRNIDSLTFNIFTSEEEEHTYAPSRSLRPPGSWLSDFARTFNRGSCCQESLRQPWRFEGLLRDDSIRGNGSIS